MLRDRTRRRALVAAALVTCTLAAGCADEDDGSAGEPSTPASTETTDPTETEPTSEPTSTETSESTEPTDPEPTETETTETEPTDPPGGGLEATLVPAADLPGFNEQVGWRERATSGKESDPPVWVCQRATQVTYGATDAVQRTYRATAGPGRAVQVVGRYADGTSARRAYGALLGNARTCAEALVGRDREPIGAVRPLSDLDVPAAAAAAWGVVFSRPTGGGGAAGFIDAVVVVRVGELVAVVSMSTVGQDFNYLVGESPPELAAPIVADLLATAR